MAPPEDNTSFEYLSSPEDRILGFPLGADDYLAQPFRFEELVPVVEGSTQH